MKVGRTLGLVLVILALVACSDGDSESSSPAGEAAKRHMEFFIDREFERQYDELHPAQQTLLTKQEYVDCANAEIGTVPKGTKISVAKTQDGLQDVPLTEAKDQEGVVVTLHLRAGDEQQELTFSEFLVDGQYRWAFPQASMQHCIDKRDEGGG